MSEASMDDLNEIAEQLVAVHDQREQMRERRKHRAIIPLSLEELGDLLGVPEDCTVVTVHYNWRSEQLEVGVMSDRFYTVPDCCEAPMVDRILETVSCEYAQLHTRLVFPERSTEPTPWEEQGE